MVVGTVRDPCDRVHECDRLVIVVEAIGLGDAIGEVRPAGQERQRGRQRGVVEARSARRTGFRRQRVEVLTDG